MAFPQALARQQDAIFARLGEDADWDGVGTVRVLRRESDDTIQANYSDLVATGYIIRVRKAEVPAPAEGQVVQVLDENGDPLPNGMFQVAGEPILDRRGAWRCPVKPLF